MQTTSYFAGIELNQSIFSDLFIELQNFLKNKEIPACIELQNILSLHITLYYFDPGFKIKDLQKIVLLIQSLKNRNKNKKIYVRNFNYFKKSGVFHICYLEPNQQKFLINSHHKFDQNFAYKNNQVAEIHYSYIPHITLFKIQIQSEFQKNKNHIERIIQKHLNIIKNDNIFKSFNLYQVNSSYKPEIQIPIFGES